MNKNITVTLIVILFSSVAFVYFLNILKVDETIGFNDIKIETNKDAIAQIASGYISLPSLSADESSIINLIGTVVIRSYTDKGEERWSYDIRYRPSRELIHTKIIDETLYQGVVSAKANFGGKFQIASADSTTDELAEANIRNLLFAGYKDQSDIPFKSLSKVKTSVGKDYFFVESVIVTDITSRRFRKLSGNGKIQGMAFGANGNIYSEQGVMKSEKVISFRPINLLDLQPGEAGSANEFTRLTSKSRKEKLSTEEASKLVENLWEKTKIIAPASVPLEKPLARLPNSLIGLETLIWYKTIQPQRQSSLNRCWAATMAMMYSWRAGRQVAEIEAATSIGPNFESLYDRDASLPRSYKLSLLKSAGLNYSAPQSYTPEGLIYLLKEHGPAWFTIDKEFGRHATVLTGVFLDLKKNEYWVSYIDPADGTLKADNYSSYMRRYEAPAYRANSEGIDIAMTEQDLDIQVVHW
ncbi:MAG: hypothetical protein GQ582_06730 [Methyloprofundus sp.]|nr:hypothetical protein [Methyloprofundus sp.]